MEQIYIDKFDEYREKAMLKYEAFKKEYETFINEFFTEDIKDMLRALPLINGDTLVFKMPDDTMIRIKKYSEIYYKTQVIAPYCVSSDIRNRLYCDSRFSYEEGKRLFDDFINIHNTRYELFCYIRDHVQDVVDAIAKAYEETTKKRLEELKRYDKLFEISDGKVKHIKVTVEWKDGD